MAYEEVGIALGDMLQRYGLSKMQAAEDERRDERRRQLDSMADQAAEERRARREAKMRGPQRSTRTVIGEDGAAYEEYYEARVNPDTLTYEEKVLGRRRAPAKAGRTRTYPDGDKRVTEEYDEASGEWKQIADAPRWAPQQPSGKSSGAQSPRRSWAPARDPENPEAWRYVDRDSGAYATDAQGRVVEAPPPYANRQRPSSRPVMGEPAAPLLSRHRERQATQMGGPPAPQAPGAPMGPAAPRAPLLAAGQAQRPAQQDSRAAGLEPDDAQTLSAARAALAQGASRALVRRRLEEAGKTHLAELL